MKKDRRAEYKKRSSELGQGNRARREAGAASRRERREKTLLAKRRRGMVGGPAPALAPAPNALATMAPAVARAPDSASTTAASDGASFPVILRNLRNVASDAAAAVFNADVAKRSLLTVRQLRQHLVGLSDTGTDKHTTYAGAEGGAHDTEDRLRDAVIVALGAGAAEDLAALLDPFRYSDTSAAVKQQQQQVLLDATWCVCLLSSADVGRSEGAQRLTACARPLLRLLHRELQPIPSADGRSGAVVTTAAADSARAIGDGSGGTLCEYIVWSLGNLSADDDVVRALLMAPHAAADIGSRMSHVATAATVTATASTVMGVMPLLAAMISQGSIATGASVPRPASAAGTAAAAAASAVAVQQLAQQQSRIVQQQQQQQLQLQMQQVVEMVASPLSAASLRIATWTLANLARGRTTPARAFAAAAPFCFSFSGDALVIGQGADVIKSLVCIMAEGKLAAAAEAAWALSYLTARTNEDDVVHFALAAGLAPAIATRLATPLPVGPHAVRALATLELEPEVGTACADAMAEPTCAHKEKDAHMQLQHLVLTPTLRCLGNVLCAGATSPPCRAAIAAEPRIGAALLSILGHATSASYDSCVLHHGMLMEAIWACGGAGAVAAADSPAGLGVLGALVAVLCIARGRFGHDLAEVAAHATANVLGDPATPAVAVVSAVHAGVLPPVLELLSSSVSDLALIRALLGLVERALCADESAVDITEAAGGIDALENVQYREMGAGCPEAPQLQRWAGCLVDKYWGAGGDWSSDEGSVGGSDFGIVEGFSHPGTSADGALGAVGSGAGAGYGPATPPPAPAGRGRGRGTCVPAWMAQQQHQH
eukprot:g1927.t1